MALGCAKRAQIASNIKYYNDNNYLSRSTTACRLGGRFISSMGCSILGGCWAGEALGSRPPAPPPPTRCSTVTPGASPLIPHPHFLTTSHTPQLLHRNPIVSLTALFAPSPQVMHRDWDNTIRKQLQFVLYTLSTFFILTLFTPKSLDF